jgi:hypothetical protein
VISVQFQNLSQANSEILKAFNSATSAKALEAYQPLSTKERKREKLKALQILKASSESPTLADISLPTDSLAIALQKAEGATLQAMLNLLSAKMIEQNKYTYFDQEKQIDLKEEQGEDKEQAKQEEQAKEQKKSAVDQLVEAAATYFKELQEAIIERYSKTMSMMSLENLRKALDESVKVIVRYAYEVPIESFKEYVIDPINEFGTKVTEYIDEGLKNGFISKSKKTFNHKEIRSMLQQTLSTEREEKLENSVLMLDRSLRARAQMHIAKQKFTKDEIKLALHK